MRYFQFEVVPKYRNILVKISRIPFYKFFATYEYLMKRLSPTIPKVGRANSSKTVWKKEETRWEGVGEPETLLQSMSFPLLGLFYSAPLPLPQKIVFHFDTAFRIWLKFLSKLVFPTSFNVDLMRILRDEALGDTCWFHKEDGNMNCINQSTCLLAITSRVGQNESMRNGTSRIVFISKTSKGVSFDWFLRTRRKWDLLTVRSIKLLVRLYILTQ